MRTLLLTSSLSAVGVPACKTSLCKLQRVLLHSQQYLCSDLWKSWAQLFLKCTVAMDGDVGQTPRTRKKSILFTFEEYGALNLLGPVLLNSLNTRRIVNCQ